MSKFELGDVVVIVGVTDLDGEFVEAGTQITDPKHELTMDWRDPQQTLIGTVGTVVENAMNDYYDISIHFDWNADNEMLSFKEADAEKVLAYKVTGTIPTPMSNPRRPAFDHHPSTEPSKKAEAIGEAGHTVTVTTESKTVADQLVSVYEKVFEKVTVEAVR
jgi:hypothetical protein